MPSADWDEGVTEVQDCEDHPSHQQGTSAAFVLSVLKQDFGSHLSVLGPLELTPLM